MNNFLGNQPVKMVIKLILLSLFVGFILQKLNITPLGLFEWALDSIDRIMNISFDKFEKVIGYIITGAVVVIPVWLLKRMSDKKRDDRIKNTFTDNSNF